MRLIEIVFAIKAKFADLKFNRMAWSEKLKLNKHLLNKVTGMGYTSPA